MLSYLKNHPGLLLLSGAIVLLGCASALYTPSQEDAERAKRAGMTTSLPRLLEGRELYARTCAGCHTLPRPGKYAPGHWPGLLHEMVREQEVQLGRRDSTLILEYLQVAGVQADTT